MCLTIIITYCDCLSLCVKTSSSLEENLEGKDGALFKKCCQSNSLGGIKNDSTKNMEEKDTANWGWLRRVKL